MGRNDTGRTRITATSGGPPASAGGRLVQGAAGAREAATARTGSAGRSSAATRKAGWDEEPYDVEALRQELSVRLDKLVAARRARAGLPPYGTLCDRPACRRARRCLDPDGTDEPAPAPQAVPAPDAAPAKDVGPSIRW